MYLTTTWVLISYKVVFDRGPIESNNVKRKGTLIDTFVFACTYLIGFLNNKIMLPKHVY